MRRETSWPLPFGLLPRHGFDAAAVPLAVQFADDLLEGFSGAARDERLLRRGHEAVAGGPFGGSHGLNRLVEWLSAPLYIKKFPGIPWFSMDTCRVHSSTRGGGAMRVIWRVAVCLAMADAAAAQPASATITGTITGDGGNRLAGVVVTVQNQITDARRTATTNPQGRDEIASLPVDGEYQVSVALAGFASAGSENVQLVANAIFVLNFRLKLTVTEVVAVSAPSPNRDTAMSSVQQVVSDQLVHALPL